MDVTVTITNLIITITNLTRVLSNLDHKCPLHNYLSIKFGVFPSKFKGDMHYS